MVKAMRSGAPAEGKLQPGDQITCISDEHNTWDTYKGLRTGEFGPGVIGSTVTIQIIRDGQTLEFTLTRELIEDDSDLTVARLEELFRIYLMEDWPNLEVKIEHVVAEDDLVSVFTTNSGTSAEFKRNAVWAESDLYPIRDGKIVESWNVEDGVNRMKQEGYSFQSPVT